LGEEGRPRVIVLENVEEFQTWGPVDDAGQPIKAEAGTTFREWLGELTSLGYHVEYRSIVAADYGAPTTRKRLFLVARCDGKPIVWPEPTHGKGRGEAWRPAAEIIDWSLPAPSIFGRKKALAEATLKRIAAGIQRYVVDTATPFIIRHGHYSTITGAGLREGCGAGTFRGQPLSQPLATVCATNDKHIVCPIVTKHYGGVVGHRVDQTLGTVTATDHHALTAATLAPRGADRRGDVRAFLTKFYGTSIGSDIQMPLPTVTAGGHHIGLVTIRGEAFEIVDIGMRMLQPHELFAAQGFPSTYDIAPLFRGKPLTKTDQTALAGNSVCPDVARAVVAEQVRRRSEAA
jgi:DNA (cytosine-5)-methyltransferase 1